MSADDWATMCSRVIAGDTIAEVARQFAVDQETLWRRQTAGSQGSTRFGPRPVMGRTGEQKVVDWLLFNHSVGMCVTKQMLRMVAMRYAADMPAGSSFVGGRKWFKFFFGRHPELALRKPELTEKHRMLALQPEVVARYFEEIKPHILKRPSSLLYCIDEVGVDLMNRRVDMVSAAWIWRLRRAIAALLVGAYLLISAPTSAPCRLWPRRARDTYRCSGTATDSTSPSCFVSAPTAN